MLNRVYNQRILVLYMLYSFWNVVLLMFDFNFIRVWIVFKEDTFRLFVENYSHNFDALSIVDVFSS